MGAAIHLGRSTASGKTNTTVTGGVDEVAGSKTLSALSSVNSERMLSTVSQIEDERRIRPAADNAPSADGSFRL